MTVAGVDADGDGVKNPQDIADAATATGVYLCSGPGDLALPNDLHSAIMRYNASESYVALVTSIAETYRLGVSALPASEPTTSSLAPTSVFTAATPDTSSVSVKPVPALLHRPQPMDRTHWPPGHPRPSSPPPQGCPT